MAVDKNSFVAYTDWIDIFEELEDDEAGRLAKHLWRYVNDMNPKTDDKMVRVSFTTIKNTLKRDLVKYEAIKERNRKNGEKGGRPKKPSGLIENPEEPQKADSVSVLVSDSVNEIYKEKDHLRITWTEMNKLIDEFGEIKADEYINQVLNYRKNVKYKSLYLTALKWLKRDFKKPTGTKNTILSV